MAAVENKPVVAANTSLDHISEPVSAASAERDEEKNRPLDAAASSSPDNGQEKIETNVTTVPAAPAEPAKRKSKVVLTIVAICVCKYRNTLYIVKVLCWPYT